MNVTTRIETPGQVFERQRLRALQLRRSTAAERIARLRALEAAVLAHARDIHRALAEDLGRPEPEAELGDIMPVLTEIRHAARHLRQWMRPRRVPASRALFGTSARIVPQPRGVALILSPWNYPFALTLGPLASALAAGCTAIIKPSEVSGACAAVLASIIGKTFAPEDVALFEGGVELAEALLDLPFDHVFFTGSPAVGRGVMAAAAKHLSSVTLELGGKSPVIVDASADLPKAAASIAWAKFLNAGQTCIAPDHLFVHNAKLPDFLDEMRNALDRMFGADPARSPDYGRIINARHFARLSGLLEDALAHGARIEAGGAREAASRFIAPTLLTGTGDEAAISREEIFGPLLPVIGFDDPAEVIARINAGPKPLALYIYARDEARIARVMAETSSGGAGVNIAVLQFSHPNLPFGGVNESGLGAAHGLQGFNAFSHERAVLRDRFSAISMTFPPYTARARWLARILARHFA